MNRRGFFGLLAGIAAAPAAIAAVFKPKPALPPIPELPGFHIEGVKPKQGPLFAATDMCAYPDRDYCVTVVYSRDPVTKAMFIHDYFEYPHEAVGEYGLDHLERVSIDCVRRALRDGKVYIPARMHRVDVTGHVLAQDTSKWKHLEFP